MAHDKSYKIRTASPADAPAIGRVNVDSWRITYKSIVHQSFLDSLDYEKRAESALQRINDPLVDSIVVESSQGIVRFSDLGPSRESKIDADGELYTIYLCPEVQSKGIGTDLFSKVYDRAKERHFRAIFVSVLSANARAIGFYERMGGVRITSDYLDIEGRQYTLENLTWLIS